METCNLKSCVFWLVEFMEALPVCHTDGLWTYTTPAETHVSTYQHLMNPVFNISTKHQILHVLIHVQDWTGFRDRTNNCLNKDDNSVKSLSGKYYAHCLLFLIVYIVFQSLILYIAICFFPGYAHVNSCRMPIESENACGQSTENRKLLPSYFWVNNC